MLYSYSRRPRTYSSIILYLGSYRLYTILNKNRTTALSYKSYRYNRNNNIKSIKLILLLF
jgi:hypothetical protein